MAKIKPQEVLTNLVDCAGETNMCFDVEPELWPEGGKAVVLKVKDQHFLVSVKEVFGTRAYKDIWTPLEYIGV